VNEARGPRERKYAAFSAALCFAIFVLSVLTVLPAFERFFMRQSATRGEATLSLAAEGLNGALRRFEALPGLIAERPVLTELLGDPSNAALLDRVNAEFLGTTEAVGASDIFMMDTSGLTIAASSYLKELSFVGRNFRYRPYFTEALAGGLGRFFALGTTSGERGYFFAAPVRDADRIRGVLAVKFTVDTFEETWRDKTSEIVVEDTAGVIFMASRPEWHFRSFSPLTDEARERIAVTRQYPLDQVRTLGAEILPFGSEHRLVRLAQTGFDPEEFIVASQLIPEAGWKVSILTPTADARQQAIAAFALLMLVVAVVALLAAIILQRRAGLEERVQAAQRMRTELERRVVERTSELAVANRQLTQEVDERRTAEDRLKRTQADLVQAGKLAALGHMAAALSHEFNQPLAAVKAFAVNATAYLDRNDVGTARDNIVHINQMADRMAAISSHLRNFARRPGERTGPVLLDRVVSDALAITEPKLRSAGAKTILKCPQREIWVRAGHVRLQQVVVNLLSNALDATEGAPEPDVEIEIAEVGDRVRVSVRDHGPGIPAAHSETVFDPFFTTKDPGRGLGLGLSISYNIIRDFGGSLSAGNHPEGGAVFTVDLERVAPPVADAAAE
jgi:two-component system C4-dicarboxylate transport sensor histidine kinase DctB